jgi:hypothetical protein
MRKRRRKPTVLSIGSVSHGTMREEDLIPEFLDLADSIRLSKEDRRRIQEIRRRVSATRVALVGFAHPEYWTSEEAAEDLNETLFDVLNAYVPPYCYFGAHAGDGSDYGVWPSHDALDDAIREGEVWDTRKGKYEPQSTERTWRYRLVVSDHGNMTLYRRNGQEVWGVV